jgi:hypothetical protein
MKITFDMEWEQVDAIIISELKSIYNGTKQLGDAEEDPELANAARVLLRHFMIRDEFYEWLKQEGE